MNGLRESYGVYDVDDSTMRSTIPYKRFGFFVFFNLGRRHLQSLCLIPGYDVRCPAEVTLPGRTKPVPWSLDQLHLYQY